VRWRVHGHAVRINVQTEYPAGETVRIGVRVREPLQFPLHLRIPAWAEGATLSVHDEESFACAPGTFATVDRLWANGDALTLTLPLIPRARQGYHRSVWAERGPLVYALPITEAPWNLALLPERGFACATQNDMPILHAFAAPVPGWKRSGDAPAPPPVTPLVDAADIQSVTLVPYGETGARIAQFPTGQMARA
jgi:DUF1680 family protein